MKPTQTSPTSAVDSASPLSTPPVKQSRDREGASLTPAMTLNLPKAAEISSAAPTPREAPDFNEK
jgi:hypothetical protein